MSSEETLKNAFIQAVGIPADTDFSNVRYGETDGWDSVAHMQLVAEIENAFDIMFTTEQVIEMSSFEKGREIAASHGVVFAA